jgi:hypothetical protein
MKFKKSGNRQTCLEKIKKGRYQEWNTNIFSFIKKISNYREQWFEDQKGMADTRIPNWSLEYKPKGRWYLGWPRK